MLIFGVDEFMSECRALVNFYDSAVATLAIPKWDEAVDIDRARRALADRISPGRSAAVTSRDASRSTPPSSP
ncbi:hypothetical protein HUO13_25240 [Saccharopolyspora erythraea]|uniref:hypothetical protein n=1 Tax=Saccharopolyspora erythraea TaxID=1836 RepID=UPI001BADDC12|nr:hypothetical protein [Saccharopolyspora erythraea]QUH03682.1 hypothetical protein HUO13_25240 [Saccharopolyspora erythraea]